MFLSKESLVPEIKSVRRKQLNLKDYVFTEWKDGIRISFLGKQMCFFFRQVQKDDKFTYYY